MNVPRAEPSRLARSVTRFVGDVVGLGRNLRSAVACDVGDSCAGPSRTSATAGIDGQRRETSCGSERCSPSCLALVPHARHADAQSKVTRRTLLRHLSMLVRLTSCPQRIHGSGCWRVMGGDAARPVRPAKRHGGGSIGIRSRVGERRSMPRHGRSGLSLHSEARRNSTRRPSMPTHHFSNLSTMRTSIASSVEHSEPAAMITACPVWTCAGSAVRSADVRRCTCTRTAA